RFAIRHIPLLARLALQRERERWCRIMAFALLARISIVDAMRLAADGLKDMALQERAINASRELRVGSRVADAIAEIRLLDEAQLSLVRAGEESGLLADMFRRIAIDTEEGLRESLKRTTGVLEQSVVVAVSLFVGLIVYGLIASLTSVYETIPL
ncbi:MAG: type II secretion system F family protein, partial [Sphingorhabdus sp.]|nr:type II secretion system F family protein [Sphingorhabdus sp.]